MMKMTTCLAIILIACFAALKLIDVQSDVQESWPSVVAHDKAVRERAVNYFLFKDSFQIVLESLRNGEIKLAEGIERVNRAAQCYHPEHFVYIALVESGSSPTEHIARNLVGHVANLEEIHAPSKSHLPRLEIELDDILKKEAP